jgi:two-component system, cell cycle response regulator DivK
MTQGTSILLVEDNELNRSMMVRRLNRAGLQVITAGNGQQALDIMHAEQPSVVLMDMNLPILDGWAASRRAKEDESIRHATEAYRLYALAAGCDDYATKPVDFPSLLIKIKTLTRA